MSVLLKIFLSFLTPVCAHTDIQMFENSTVLIQWQDYGENYEYMIEVFDDTNQDLIEKSDWLNNNSMEVEVDKEGLYLWNLYIKENGKVCDDEHQCIKIESGYFYLSLSSPEKEIVKEIEEEKILDEKEDLLNETIDIKSNSTEEKVLGTSIKEPEEKEIIEEIEEEKEVDLKENSCVFKYNIKKKDFYLENCKIQKPQITSSTYNSYENSYIVNTSGNYQNLIDIQVDTVTCKNFDLLDTTTWFKCEEVFIRSDSYKNIKLYYEAYFLTSKIVSPSNFIFKDKSFEILTEVNKIPSKILIQGYFSLEHNGHWLDQEMHITIPLEFKEQNTGDKGIYSFPFNKIVYVNQWHGCTEYQCPHKGIDFAAVKDNIYASDDGIVVSKGYDTYSGECNSGGNYLVIKYDGGHHMAYLHLEKSYANVNQKVKKGDLIALSGNSGSHNCQPLGYHLHFELREERSQKTHIDPVLFINIDWNLVKTNKSNLFPKRLSGDNPHPNF